MVRSCSPAGRQTWRKTPFCSRWTRTCWSCRSSNSCTSLSLGCSDRLFPFEYNELLRLERYILPVPFSAVPAGTTANASVIIRHTGGADGVPLRRQDDKQPRSLPLKTFISIWLSLSFPVVFLRVGVRPKNVCNNR